MFAHLSAASRSALRDLLADGRKNALRVLRAAYGFDFEKPFSVEYIAGRYTVPAVEKRAAAAGLGADVFAVLLTRDGDKAARGYYCEKYNIVKLCGYGRIDIDMPRRGLSLCDNGLNDFYRKADFEEIRKSFSAQTFMIVQARADMHAQEQKPIDRAGRFFWTADNWYTRIFEYDTRRKAQEVRRGAADVSALIDASGYLLQDRRNDLRCRAAALRAERAKNAFLAVDYSGHVSRLRSMLDARRAACVAALAACNTSEEYEKAGKMIDSYSSGLRWIAYSVEQFAARVHDHKYNSPEEADSAYNAIYNKLAALVAREMGV